MNEQLKQSDMWAIDQPPPTGHHQRTRESWSSPTSSSTHDHVSPNQKYLLKKAIGIVSQGVDIEDACARVWGPDAVSKSLVRDVEQALKNEK